MKAASVPWRSPITSELITTKALRLGAPSFGPDGSLYFLEGRPSEAGRQVLMRRETNTIRDITPAVELGFNVRTRVHEYGGGDYVADKTTVFFSNFKDQRIYFQDVEGAPSEPQALTPDGQGVRFADYQLDTSRGRLVCVCEQHNEGDHSNIINSIMAVGIKSGVMQMLAHGHDFYTAPRLSPDGSRLAWLQWDFPNMPWDGTELIVAEVKSDGSLGQHIRIAGGQEESVQQPSWSADGRTLYFITDAAGGWWNIHSWDVASQKVVPMHSAEADFGFPLWVFDTKTFHVFSSGHVLAIYNDPSEAGQSLGMLNPGSKTFQKLPAPFSSYSKLAVHETNGGAVSVASVAAAPTESSKLVLLEAVSVEELVSKVADGWQVVKASSNVQVDPGYLSAPQCLSFPTEAGRTAYMVFYPPVNKDYSLPDGEKPPLLVKSHGGPTSAAAVMLSLSIQYFTSRGIAVADVNYGGSTGYGREYRNRLRGQWGIVDVDDCSNAAKFLASEGLVDPKRMCISGGSAGGYTTLACLAFRDVFAAGASLYGVADLELLAKDTHKFESRYLDILVGPYPEARNVYVQRSPIHHVDGFTSPIIFFQGDEDAVVPPEQAIQMHATVMKRGLPTALVMFKGEQHGFRKTESIRVALDGELFFYAQALGLSGDAAMPTDLPPINIDNLK